MSRSSIFLGDLADALHVLDPRDSDTEAQIAALLNLPPRVAAPRDEGLDIERPPDDVDRESRQQTPTSEPPKPATLFYPSEITSTRRGDAEVPSVALIREETPVLSFGGSEVNEERMPLEPLLRPASNRAIVSAAVSTKLAIGIDVPRTVEALARREAIEHLPLRRVRSVRRGVQLLLDKSAGMMPFFRDQVAVTRSLQRIVGAQMVKVETFVRVPECTLLRGRPIVLLTDLGIARPRTSEPRSTVADWLEFAALAKKANCPLVAFVPYEAARWPAALHRAMSIVPWDRTLTAGRAARPSRSIA